MGVSLCMCEQLYCAFLPNNNTMTAIAIPRDTHGFSWWIRDDMDSPKPTTYSEQATAWTKKLKRYINVS